MPMEAAVESHEGDIEVAVRELILCMLMLASDFSVLHEASRLLRRLLCLLPSVFPYSSRRDNPVVHA